MNCLCMRIVEIIYPWIPISNVVDCIQCFVMVRRVDVCHSWSSLLIGYGLFTESSMQQQSHHEAAQIPPLGYNNLLSSGNESRSKQLLCCAGGILQPCAFLTWYVNTPNGSFPLRPIRAFKLPYGCQCSRLRWSGCLL